MPKVKNKEDKFLTGIYGFFSLRECKPQKSQEKLFLFLSSRFYDYALEPHFLSCVALILAILAGGFLLRSFTMLAGILFAFSWFFSYYDGIYARHTSTDSQVGDLFNDLVDVLCDLFLLIPLLINSIFSVSYFLALMLLWLLVLHILTMFLRHSLHNAKIRQAFGFFGRTELWWVFILGFLLNLPILAVMLSIFLLLVVVVQLSHRFFILYTSTPKRLSKPPIKSAKKKLAPALKKRKQK